MDNWVFDGWRNESLYVDTVPSDSNSFSIDNMLRFQIKLIKIFLNIVYNGRDDDVEIRNKILFGSFQRRIDVCTLHESN